MQLSIGTAFRAMCMVILLVTIGHSLELLADYVEFKTRPEPLVEPPATIAPIIQRASVHWRVENLDSDAHIRTHVTGLLLRYPWGGSRMQIQKQEGRTAWSMLTFQYAKRTLPSLADFQRIPLPKTVS